MAVVQRGKAWQVQVRVGRDPRTGKWIRKSATADTKAAAEKLERQLLAEAEESRAHFVEPSGETLAGYLAGWMARERPRLRPATRASYDNALKHIIPALGSAKLADLSPRKVQAFLDGMGARRVTELARLVLVSALGDAERLGAVAVNVAKRTEAPYRAAPKRTSFTREEAVALVQACAGTRYGHAIALALWTGLRRGEICGLRWEDVDWDAPSVAVRRSILEDGAGRWVEGRPKTAAGEREVPLIPQAVAVLKAQRVALAATGAVPVAGWVFTAEGGGPARPRSLTVAVGRATARTGLPDLPMHSLRHTTASLLLSAGVPAEQAAKMMGHRSLAVFYRTYADLLRPAAQDAAAKLARYLEAQEKAPKVAAMSANVSAKAATATERPRRSKAFQN